MKYHLLHGIIAGVLSSLAGVVYQQMYQEAMFLDFSQVINVGSITGASILGCLLMALGYWLLEKVHKLNLKGWLNILIVAITFMSILFPIGATLPFEVESPELFPGLAIPMHFFPALIFFVLVPFFRTPNKKTTE